jgi:hypothetical protein
VGEQWQELALVARRRRHDTTLVCATLHHLLALAAVGDRVATSDVLLALQHTTAAEAGEQGPRRTDGEKQNFYSFALSSRCRTATHQATPTRARAPRAPEWPA